VRHKGADSLTVLSYLAFKAQPPTLMQQLAETISRHSTQTSDIFVKQPLLIFSSFPYLIEEITKKGQNRCKTVTFKQYT
jgi:hypothetical protein